MDSTIIMSSMKIWEPSKPQGTSLTLPFPRYIQRALSIERKVVQFVPIQSRINKRFSEGTVSTLLTNSAHLLVAPAQQVAV